MEKLNEDRSFRFSWHCINALEENNQVHEKGNIHIPPYTEHATISALLSPAKAHQPKPIYLRSSVLPCSALLLFPLRRPLINDLGLLYIFLHSIWSILEVNDIFDLGLKACVESRYQSSIVLARAWCNLAKFVGIFAGYAGLFQIQKPSRILQRFVIRHVVIYQGSYFSSSWGTIYVSWDA
jgi:hypothetical protein